MWMPSPSVSSSTFFFFFFFIFEKYAIFFQWLLSFLYAFFAVFLNVISQSRTFVISLPSRSVSLFSGYLLSWDARTRDKMQLCTHIPKIYRHTHARTSRVGDTIWFSNKVKKNVLSQQNIVSKKTENITQSNEQTEDRPIFGFFCFLSMVHDMLPMLKNNWYESLRNIYTYFVCFYFVTELLTYDETNIKY